MNIPELPATPRPRRWLSLCPAGPAGPGLLLLLFGTACHAGLTITSPAPGEELRYPAALVVGFSDSGPTVTVHNRDNDRPDGHNQAPVVDGRFKVLVELRPGTNHLDLSAGNDQVTVELAYRPMTTPYHVSVVYLVGSDGDAAYPSQFPDQPQDHVARLRTAATLMQTFTAEALLQVGLGRKTFRLERDEGGDVVVHTVALPETGDQLRARDPDQQWHRSNEALSHQFDYATTRLLVMNGFVRYDAEHRRMIGHTALGGGAIGVFSSNSLCAWPTSLRDVARAFADTTPVDDKLVGNDTAGRDTVWSLAATGIGAWLHELGHAFGLPHSPDPRGIMARGFDHFDRTFAVVEASSHRHDQPYAFKDDERAYWEPLFAHRLDWSPWFQADGERVPDGPGPSILVDWSTDELQVTVPGGIGLVEAEGPQQRAVLAEPEWAGKQALTLKRADLRRQFEAPHGVVLTVVDRHGRTTQFDDAAARNPAWFVHTWQVLPEPREWTGAPNPVALDAAALSELTATLKGHPLSTWAPPRTASQYSFDFNQRYGYHGNSLSYLRREIRADTARRIKLLAGGDDGFRIWLNGEQVADATGVHVIPPDGSTAEVELRQGANELLIESQQGPGGWTFSLRLTEPDGTRLRLTDEGALERDED